MNVIAASATGLVTLLNAYVEEFNAADEELYTNAIPNSAAAEFLALRRPMPGNQAALRRSAWVRRRFCRWASASSRPPAVINRA